MRLRLFVKLSFIFVASGFFVEPAIGGMCHLQLFMAKQRTNIGQAPSPEYFAAEASVSKEAQMLHPDGVLVFLKGAQATSGRSTQATVERIQSSNLGDIDRRSFFAALEELHLLNPQRAEEIVRGYWSDPTRPFFATRVQTQNALKQARENHQKNLQRVQNIKEDRLQGAAIVMNLLKPLEDAGSLADLLKIAERDFKEAAANAKSDAGRQMFLEAARKIENRVDPISSGETFRLAMNQTLGFSVAAYREGEWVRVASEDNVLKSPNSEGLQAKALVRRAVSVLQTGTGNRLDSVRDILESAELNHSQDKAIIDEALRTVDQMQALRNGENVGTDASSLFLRLERLSQLDRELALQGQSSN